MMMEDLARQAEAQGYSKEWRDWFAWYPVHSPPIMLEGGECLDEKVYWLAKVQYRWDGSGYDPSYLYRLTEEWWMPWVRVAWLVIGLIMVSVTSCSVEVISHASR